jgi:hypothetical protein
MCGECFGFSLTNESRVRHYRLSLKGGEEEKSPYNQYHSKSWIIVLDDKPTITLRFTNIIES